MGVQALSLCGCDGRGLAFFDVYTLTFVEDALQGWQKTGGPTSKDFERADAFMAAMGQTGSDVNRAFSRRARSTPAPPVGREQERSGVSGGGVKLMLFGGEGRKTYLGCLNCSRYEHDSIFNPYGEHGSEYSGVSIFNSYSDHGSAYSDYGVCNPYAQNAPVVVDGNGNFYGRLTLNPYADPVEQPDIKAFLAGLCSRYRPSGK